MGLWASRAEEMIQESFLEFLVRQETSQRLTSYAIYENYYQGFQGETLPSDVKKQFDDPQSAMVNYCKAVVNIATRYIAGTATDPNSLSVDATEGGLKTDGAYLAQTYLNRVYKESGLFDTQFIKLVRMMCKKGDTFMKLRLVGADENRDVRISVVRPDVVYPRYRDDDYESMIYCAVKWFEMEKPNERRWFAEVFRGQSVDEAGAIVPGVREIYDLGTQGAEQDRAYTEDNEGVLRMQFNRPVHYESGAPQPRLIGVYESGFPEIPIYHIKNDIDDLEFGVSDLQDVIPLQDNLNRVVSDMLYALDYMGFPREFIFGAMGDQNIDLGPGIATQIPDPSGRVMSLPAANIGHFLYAIDSIIDWICGVSSTPKQALAEYAQALPASGYSLRVRYQPLEDKCNEKRAGLKQAFRNMNRQILYVAGQLGILDADLVQRLEVDVHFGGGLPADKLTEAQMYGYYQQYGWMSKRTIQERIGIENAKEENLRIQQEQYEEYLMMLRAEKEVGVSEESD